MRPKKSKKQQHPPVRPETATCLHCRYERPAKGVQCPICGHPWPFAIKGHKGAMHK